MMKTVVVVLALFAIAHAFSLSKTVKQLEQMSSKRQTTSCDYKVNCVKRGGACTVSYLPPPCQQCSDALTACITANIQNQTNVCNCFITAVNCGDATGLPQCPGSAIKSTCESLSSLTGPCTCGTPSTTPVTLNYCDGSNFCGNATAVCTALSPKGGSCATSNDCGYSSAPITLQSFTCNAGVCDYAPGSVASGDPCSANADCASNTCTGGVCVGKSNGQTCTDSSECLLGSFCQNGQCAAVFAAGTSCNYNPNYATPDDACAVGYSCVSGICTEYFALSAGAACNDSFQCSSGLVCSSYNGKCQTPPPAKTCTANSDCPADAGYLGCTCDGKGGQSCVVPTPFSPSFISSYKGLAKCVAGKCKGVSQDPNSCASKNCQNEVNCALNAYATVAYVDGCEGNLLSCTGSASFITFSLALVAALFALVI